MKSTHRTSRYPAPLNGLDPSLPARTGCSESRANGTLNAESVLELKRLVTQLTVQVGELSRQVSKAQDEDETI